MPQPELVWNETDFLVCLEVEPEVDEYRTCCCYRVSRHALRLELTVFPYDGDICITLHTIGVELPIFDMRMEECSGTRYVNDERGEYLEFAPARVFGNRYDGESPIPYGVRLSVNPAISVQLF